MFKYFLIYILFTSITFGQKSDRENLLTKGRKIFLFGETHFVKEKYEEMKSFIFNSLDTVSSGKRVTMFFELPSSLNYAISRIKIEKDTSVFFDWFNHLYSNKGKSPSYFWTDYRDFILELLQYTEKRGIDLNLKCIDVELEFRRTAFILSSLENKSNTKIDSLLNVEYIRNDSVNRAFLLGYVNKLLYSSSKPYKVETLNQVKSALLIDCTICVDRDQFMHDNFIKYNDPSDALVFGTFGLDHVLTKNDFYNVGEFFKMKHKIDTTQYKSLYTLMKDKFSNEIFKIGIIAFNQEMKYSSKQKTNYYNHIMKKDERDYIEMLLENKEVIRIYPSEYKELSDLSSHLDYLIIYKSSNFRH